MSLPWMAIRVAWALVHFLWQGVLLGGAAYVALALLRRRRPEVRYAAACACLLLCAVLPGVTFAVQGASPVLWGPGVQQTITYRGLSQVKGLLRSHLPLILGFWGLGAAVFALRAAASGLWLRRLARSASEVTEGVALQVVASLCRALGIRSRVDLRESPRVRGPLVHGLFRPVIYLPVGFLTGLDPLALRAVLAHELAHIRRFDVLVIGLQTLIESLLYYHPVTWWLSRRVTTERECCCDAVAVQACGDPVLFARTLHRLDAAREAVAPALAGGDLMERMLRILKRDPGPGRLPSPALSLVLAASATVLLAGQPAVRMALAHVVDRASSPRLAMELKGVGAGIAEAAPLSPAQPIRVASETGKEGSDLEPLVVARVVSASELGAVVALPTPTQVASRTVTPSRLPITALGLPFRKLFDVPIDGWEDGLEDLSAARLPSNSDTLVTLFGRSGEAGAYAFTHWPMPSTYARRLIRVNLPPRTTTTLEAQGTSNTPRDRYFVLNAYRLQTLIGSTFHWPQATQGPRLVLNNASEIPQSIVVLVTGPAKTPYRVHRTAAPMEGARDEAVPQVLVEPMDPRGWAGPDERGRVQATRLNRLWAAQQSSFKNAALKPEVSFASSAALWAEGLSELRCLEMSLEPGETIRFHVTEGRGVHLEAQAWPGESVAPWMRALDEANAVLQASGEAHHEERSMHQPDLQSFMTVPQAPTKDLVLRNPTGQRQSCALVVYRPAGFQGTYRVERRSESR